MSGLKSTSWGWYLDIAIGCVLPLLANCAIDQITPDGTLPNNYRATTQDNIRIMEGGTKSSCRHKF